MKSHMRGSTTDLLRRNIIVHLLLQLLPNGLGGDGVEIGGSEDLVDEGAVGGMLLGRDCSVSLVSICARTGVVRMLAV